MTSILYADGHLHSNPVKGLGAKNIAQRFKASDGWFMVLVSLPPHHYNLTSDFDGYVKSIEILISECSTLRSYGIETLCLAGIHPADIEEMINRDARSAKSIIELAIRVLDYISQLVKNGTIDGFGEVGRPHYKALPEAFSVNNIIMRYALTLARDLNAYIHLHLEQGGYATVRDVYEVLRMLNIDSRRVILHHLDIRTALEAENYGLHYTIPGKYPILREAIRRLPPSYIVESDFIDDPRRPGVSSYPWDAVENQKKLLSGNLTDSEYITKINIENVVKIYGVEPP
ncbi:MAG: TatD family hydrolase [Ignisphaera sp.]|uniref:Hydrolase TatD n=1 Tax=Ignisphaera aggregans TaxID=334771 RepID=A0A7J3JNU6_9CREN